MLQPCQMGDDSLLSMLFTSLLDMRGGASLCKSLEIPVEVLISVSWRCLRSGHNRSTMGGITCFPLVMEEFCDLAISN